jgi:vacuolar-type H+-ATPase subunit E/Vma4
MDPATYLIANWGIPGALVVAASLWAMRNQKTLEAGTAEHAKATLELQTAHASKVEALQKEHATALQTAQAAAQAERERILSKLEAEHAARLTDAQANTRAMLDLSEQVHATVDQLSELAERLSQRPRS